MRWGSGRTIALFVAAIKNGLISDSRPHITGLPDAQFYRLDIRGQRLTLPLHARIKRVKKEELYRVCPWVTYILHRQSCRKREDAKMGEERREKEKYENGSGSNVS